MRFVSDLPGEPLLLTGDGRGEFYLLEVLTQKLNGTTIIIYFPFFQSKVLIAIPKTRTTLAVLETLVEYVEGYDVKRFLVVLDLENFTGGIRSGVEERLGSLDVTLAKMEMLNPPYDNALHVEGRTSSGRDFIALITVMGDNTCPKIEFHIAQLVEEKYGVRIDPNQAKLKFLKKVREITGAKNYGKLVENLSEEDLIKFFPQLMHALRAIEEIVEL